MDFDSLDSGIRRKLAAKLGSIDVKDLVVPVVVLFPCIECGGIG